jgi:Protein of unknown function (DUF3094)
MSEEQQNRLDEEDMKRVQEYLSGPVQRVERKPFRPWLLLFWLWIVVSVLGGISWFFGQFYGYI